MRKFHDTFNSKMFARVISRLALVVLVPHKESIKSKIQLFECKQFLGTFGEPIVGISFRNEECVCARGEERKRERDLQHFANVASTKDLVNNGKLVGVIRREVRGENAVFGAPTPQQLAGSAWGIATHFLLLSNF
jgi:hypothetical protein